MSNNKKILLGIIISLIVLLIGIGFGYGVYKLNNNNSNNSNNKEIDNSKKENEEVENSNDEMINNESNKQEMINQKIQELLADDYEEIEFDNIDMNSELNSNEIIRNFKNSSKLYELNQDKEKKFTKSFFEMNTTFSIILDNSKVYFKLNEENKACNIKNIKNVYIINDHCNGNINIYLLTNNGTIYKLEDLDVHLPYEQAIEKVNNSINNFTKVTSNYKYENLLGWYQYTDTCAGHYSIIGETADGKRYIVEKDEEVDSSKIYRYLDRDYYDNNSKEVKIYQNRKIEYDNQPINYKVKLFFESSFVLEDYILTDNNYLYNPYENKLINNSKVVKIMKKIENNDVENYITIFENGEEFNFNIQN